MWTKLLRSFRSEDVVYLSKWRSSYKYYMALLCWVITLENYYNFGYLLELYGISFVLPALIAFTLIVIPIAYYEMAIGQFSRSTFIKVWKLCPPFKGLGLTYLCLLPIMNLQCNILNVIALEYLAGSMKTIIPWYNCKGNWVKKNCFVLGETISAQTRCYLQHNKTYCNQIKWQNSAQHYWTEVVEADVPVFSLGRQSLLRINYSAITSIILYVLLRKGVASIEPFIPFLTLAPHVLQVILFLATIFLHSTGRRVKLFYFTSYTELKNLTMWEHSFRDTLTGGNVGLGGTILFGSESTDFRTPIHMATIGAYCLCIFLSILFAVLTANLRADFCFSANISTIKNSQHRSKFSFDIMSLVFKSWPLAQIWSCCYFLIYYIMITRTKCLIMHVCLSGLYDVFPKLKHYADLCAFIAVVLDFFASLIHFSYLGIENYELRTSVFNNTCMIIMMFYETMVICFIYGTRNLIDDLHFMLGFRPSAFWKFCWYACPLATGFVVYVSFKVLYLRGSKLFQIEETWFLVALVISLTVCIFLPILYLIVYVFRRRKKKKCIAMMKPSMSWGPPDPSLKKSREMFSAHSMTKEYMYRQQRLARQFVVDSM